MTMNIRETLLHGPEDRRFRLPTQPPKIFGDLQIHFNLAALGESLDIPEESRSKSRFIQQRGMEQVGNRANFSTEFLYQRRAVVNRLGGLGEAFYVGSYNCQVHS